MELTSFKREALCNEFPVLRNWIFSLDDIQTFHVERMDAALFEKQDLGPNSYDWAEHWVRRSGDGMETPLPSTYYQGPYVRFRLLDETGAVVRQVLTRQKVQRRFLWWKWIEELPLPERNERGILRERVERIGDPAKQIQYILEYGGTVRAIPTKEKCVLDSGHLKLHKLPNQHKNVLECFATFYADAYREVLELR